jgi:hypothetical protein
MSYKNKQEIMDRLIEHLGELTKRGYENILGIFLQGSWNYDLGYENSDIDTKAIVLPSFEDFVYGREPVSTTIVLDNDEHIDVKDVRVMFDCFKKQNINFLEILFTKYKFINYNYEKLFQPVLDNREAIAHLNTNQALKCMAGMSMEKLNALEHKYPCQEKEIEQYGYSAKQAHHIARMNEFIQRYAFGEPFEQCLVTKQKEWLMYLKTNHLPVDVARLVFSALDEQTKQVKETFVTKEETFNSEANEILNKVKYDLLTYQFKKELSEK